MNTNSTSIVSLIGNTPILSLDVINPKWRLYLKLEKFNPGQSMKDRMALSIIEDAEASGRLKPGGTIIESSSGNTGTSLAMIAAAKGYRFIAVVDHHASIEKIHVMKAYGAEIVFVPRTRADNEVAVREREEMARMISHNMPNSFFANQADNPANQKGYQSLAQEILSVIPDIDILIAAIGTGGSLCGTTRVLKQSIPSLKVIAVEPKGSTIFGHPGAPYYQSGSGNPSGADLPGNIDYGLIDHYFQASDIEAFNTARFMARNYGLLVGGSSGGVLYKALEYLSLSEESGTMLALMNDGGEKYISTLFNDEWMRDRCLLDDEVTMNVKRFLR